VSPKVPAVYFFLTTTTTTTTFLSECLICDKVAATETKNIIFLLIVQLMCVC